MNNLQSLAPRPASGSTPWTALSPAWRRLQYNNEERSAAEDLDMVQAISEFQNQQSGYDAALKTYAMVQRLSLFNYISG